MPLGTIESGSQTDDKTWFMMKETCQEIGTKSTSDIQTSIKRLEQRELLSCITTGGERSKLQKVLRNEKEEWNQAIRDWL